MESLICDVKMIQVTLVGGSIQYVQIPHCQNTHITSYTIQVLH